MIKEFISAIGLERIIKDTFKTTDTAIHKDHKDHENKQNTDCSDYCNRGRMENFIEECKDGFDFASVSSQSKVVNANRLQFHTFVYNIFNLFRRLVLPGEMRKHLIDTVRLKLLKVATKVVHS